MSGNDSRTFLRRTKTVDTLPEAWAFIMAEVDAFARPSIEIQAITEYDVDTMEPARPGLERYVVAIYGDVT